MTAPEPIGPADRVSDVLARDEQLVDVFIRHSAHFEKLRNRALRRVMGPLVTVEQAARVAGVSLDVLLLDLNGALRAAATTESSPAPATAATRANGSTVPAAATRPPGLREVELDLRDDMRAGREPFARIMAAVRALEDGEALRLRTIFEPVPLFALLAKRGFSYDSRQASPDDWTVWFWRGAPVTEARESAREETPNTDLPRENTLVLDVRGLEPPQPMLRTLAALETLPEGQELVQINVRVPQLLLPILAERGYACAVDESHADRVLVRIWRPPRR